jgi:hypothetical protein
VALDVIAGKRPSSEAQDELERLKTAIARGSRLVKLHARRRAEKGPRLMVPEGPHPAMYRVAKPEDAV